MSKKWTVIDVDKNKPRKIIIYKNKPYSTFKLFCDIHGIKYNTYNRKIFPIEFNDDLIYKEPLINSFEKTKAGKPKNKNN